MSDEKSIRCTTCYSEFSEAELNALPAEKHGCCPSCGATGVPMAIREDVTLNINWHELRILGIWASNWANDRCDEAARRSLQAILYRLQQQEPDKAPLTLFGEISQLPKKLAEEGIQAGPVEHNIKPDPLVPLPGGAADPEANG